MLSHISKEDSWTLRIRWKEWSSHHSQQKCPKCILGCNPKNDRMISVRFQGKPVNITVIQSMPNVYTWTSLDGHYWNQIDYILCSWRWRSSISSAKRKLRAVCGSDHELLIAKFRLKLKKVRKTTRPFRYDLNQIPYSYTVEMTNRFKGLDLIDRVPDELWTEVRDIVQEAHIRKRNAKRQNGCLRRP